MEGHAVLWLDIINGLDLACSSIISCIVGWISTGLIIAVHALSTLPVVVQS